MEQTACDGLDAVAIWQWAVTFDNDEPTFEIDYNAVEAFASYD